MLDAATEAISSAQNRSRSDLETDHVWALGLIKCVEIIGEAAAQVSDETRVAAPKVPWREIVGMRNRLIHVYFDIDFDQVWSTVRHDLPALVKCLREICPDEPGA
jgi:uncharacterized protein with HEPN domain